MPRNHLAECPCHRQCHQIQWEKYIKETKDSIINTDLKVNLVHTCEKV